MFIITHKKKKKAMALVFLVNYWLLSHSKRLGDLHIRAVLATESSQGK